MREYVILHILTHWNKELTFRFKQTNNLIHKLIHKLLVVMSPEKETKFGITFGQLYSIALMAMAIFGAWIQINIRITTLEVDQRNDKALITKAVDQYSKIDDKLDQTNSTLNQLIGALNNVATKPNCNNSNNR